MFFRCILMRLTLSFFSIESFSGVFSFMFEQRTHHFRRKMITLSACLLSSSDTVSRFSETLSVTILSLGFYLLKGGW